MRTYKCIGYEAAHTVIPAEEGEANFVPFERAYGEAYMDELRRVRIMQEQS